MKKLTFPILVAVAATLLASIAPVAAKPNHKKEHKVVAPEVSDALEGLKVRTKLVNKLGVDALRISVAVSAGTATLTGDVPKKVTMEMAKEVALSVKGIKSVDNQVKEMVPASTTTHAKSELKDAGLEIKVKTLLLNEIGENAVHVTVESTDGTVSLRGKLDNSDIAKAAIARVEKIRGVRKVINLLNT